MSAAPDDSKRCPECKSTNLQFVGSRDHRGPRRADGSEAPVVARTIQVRCRRCKASWGVLRRVVN
ncbi:unnamed protein product [Gemmata massiliana]|uniref:Uncharacterized protein n=1 Tax=Gemmata massiliana TaxID=1210884 RepID=A0A6P2CY01_9BACT|nr:hypothetical protein [Gemmata massiliana]VTR93773.1 unnamed protein product [Gemmata massiliana]